MAIWMLQVRFFHEPKLTQISDLCLFFRDFSGALQSQLKASWQCWPKKPNQKTFSCQKAELRAGWTWDRNMLGVLWRVCLLLSCCQEGGGWPCLLLTDILPVFLQTQLAPAQLKLPRMFCCCPWLSQDRFVHRESSVGCSTLKISVLTWVNFILDTNARSVSSMEGFYNSEVLFAFLSLDFAVSVKCPVLINVDIGQNDSWPPFGGKNWTVTCKIWAHFLYQATDFMQNHRITE